MPRKRKSNVRPGEDAGSDRALSWEVLPSMPGSALVMRPSKYTGKLLLDEANRVAPGFMVETHGGGRLEAVPAFGTRRAMTAGLPEAIRPARARAVGYRRVNLQHQCREDEGASARSASPSEVLLETVHDYDERAQVSNTTSVPWRSICYLIIQRQDFSQTFGTGWFAGPKLVVTAGHCIIDHENGGWATRIIIVPGSNGEYPPPFGTVEPNQVFVDHRWRDDRNYSYDYGFLYLNEDRIGKAVGWFGFAALADASLQSVLLNNAGYPFDKPVGTLWFNGGRAGRPSRHFIEYMLDTEEGQSGSPIVYSDSDSHRIVVGVHTRGGTPNRGVRITDDIYQELLHAREL